MSKKVFDIAIVGATGAVGETILSILQERQFPIGKLFLLASERSAGEILMFEDAAITVENLANFDFSQTQIALFSAGGKVSAEFAPKAAKAGCIVIDNTSHFRYEKDIPLVISEVNPQTLKHAFKKNIIANPNCSTMGLLVALKPIHDAAHITRINVATYQSVSGVGRGGISELAEQTTKLIGGQSIKKSKIFAKQIAFNVIPQIGEFQDNGYTYEEMKMVWEIKKILEDDSIQVNPTTVRVPVFYGHSCAVHLETQQKISAQQAKQLLKKTAGLTVVDKHVAGGYPTPVTEAAGTDPVYVGRIREDISHPTGLDLWVVADNVRKGAALNAVQIAELLARDYL
jgi:aspartate-semialdehyde dehydrogenase